MSWSKIWDSVFLNQAWGKYPSESVVRFVAKNYYNKNRRNTRILEVGCGPGANIWYLSREQFNVYGIDGSTEAIRIAKKRLSSESLKGNLCVGEICSLPYKDDYFDAVIDSECLYCNSRSDTQKALAEILRVLKNNGLFYSRTFSTKMYVGGKTKKRSRYEYDSIQSGPFAGKGFVRLSDYHSIVHLYGTFFDIQSIDKNSWTIENGSMPIDEWVILAKKVA